MSNEMKLLTAFIEASGYDIEEIYEQQIPSGQIIVAHDYKVTKKPKPIIYPAPRIQYKGDA
jgi:hypothetical protein